MGGELVKRQHYVPRTYLKKFSIQRGEAFYINALKVKEPTLESIFETNIVNACLETHLYTLPGSTNEEKMLLEKFYSDEIEVHYDRVYSFLIDPLKTEINNEERDLIISTIVTMFYRTARWINLHDELMKRVFTQMYELAIQLGKDYFKFEEEKISIAGKSLADLIKEHKIENQPGQVITQLEVAMALIRERLANDGVFVIRLNEPGCEFITSDDPVIIANMQGNAKPFDKENIMKLPIDSNHIVMLMPNGNDAKNIIVRHTVTGRVCQNKANAINAVQFKKAERFILGQQSSLQNFINSGII